MTRARLPNRREGVVITVPHPAPGSAVAYDVTIGFDRDAPRELFISCNKITTALAVAGIEIATLASIALQRGATVAELAASMPREEDGQPQGAAGAVLDAVMREIGGGK